MNQSRLDGTQRLVRIAIGLSNAPPGRDWFCVRFQAPRSRARLHLANFLGPVGAETTHNIDGPNRPDGTMDISRGQLSPRMPPPITIAKSHPPRMGRWFRAITFCVVIGLTRCPTHLRRVNCFAFDSRRRARGLACIWLISLAPLGPRQRTTLMARIVPTGRWTLAGGN